MPCMPARRETRLGRWNPQASLANTCANCSTTKPTAHVCTALPSGLRVLMCQYPSSLPSEPAASLRCASPTVVCVPYSSDVVGDVLRRLGGRTLAQEYASELQSACMPCQYGLSTRAGTKALVRRLRVATVIDAHANVLSSDADTSPCLLTSTERNARNDRGSRSEQRNKLYELTMCGVTHRATMYETQSHHNSLAHTRPTLLKRDRPFALRLVQDLGHSLQAVGGAAISNCLRLAVCRWL